MIDSERNSSGKVRINILKNIMYEIIMYVNLPRFIQLILMYTFDFFEAQIKYVKE